MSKTSGTGAEDRRAVFVPAALLLAVLGLMLLAALFALSLPGCTAAAGEKGADMGAGEEWDGHCRGPRDNGRRASWRHTVYVCRDNGAPNHWYFVQDPEFYGMRVP